MTAQRIIVVGAKGFLGKRLAAKLQALGHEVAQIDMGDRVEDLQGDWETMFNVAWVGKGGALRADYEVQMGNVKAALGFYRQAQRLNCRRYICMGTIGEKMARLPECAHIKSQNLIYAMSKNYLHDILRTIEGDKCKVVWATLGNIYGGKDAGGNIVDYCLRCILKGEKAIFGPAEQPYDFVHVDDAVRALTLAGTAEGEISRELYVGSGRVKALKDYLKEIGRIAGHEELIGIGGRPDDGTRYKAEWFDIAELKRATGFEPEIAFEEGVRRNIEDLTERG